MRVKSKYSIYIFGLLCSALVYELPSLLTLVKVGWEPLPPVLVADQMLYLNLSAIHHVSPTEVLNPWYGTRVLVVDVPHLMFPVTFVLFRLVHHVFASWTAAVLTWNALWMALTFVAAAFCLESFFPNADRTLALIAAFGLLVLQSPLMYLGELRPLATQHSLFGIALPYLRFAIPQVILPCLLAYWGLQSMALRRPVPRVLVAMALLQFAVCAAFPYFLPILALGTGLTFLMATWREKPVVLTWTIVVAFASLCGVLDIGYVMVVGLAKSHANVSLTLQFRPEMIVPAIRPYMLILLAAAGLAFVSKAPVAVSSTVAGLAVSNVLFGFTEVFFSPKAQMLQHPQYVIGIVTWLPLFVCLWPLLEKAQARLRWVIICGLLGVGLLEGVSSFRSMLPENIFQRNAISALAQLDLNEEDLVIAPSRHSDDVSSWIPLLSLAKVLFTGNGENILSEVQTRTEQTTRQALYLMMSGMSLTSLESATGDRSSLVQIHPLLQQTDQTYADSPIISDRVKLRQMIRERLAPIVSKFESDPSAARSILANHRRVVLVDDTTARFFDETAFTKWLVVKESHEANGVKIYICSPRLIEDAKPFAKGLR